MNSALGLWSHEFWEEESSWHLKLGLKFGRDFYLFMTQILLSVCYVSSNLVVSGDPAVTVMDKISTFMKRSFPRRENK